MKSHFVWKFTGKMRDPIFAGAILCGNLQGKTHMDMSEEPFCVEIYRENAGHPGEHLDQTPGLNSYRKNPFSAHTVWGINQLKTGATLYLVNCHTTMENHYMLFMGNSLFRLGHFQ